MHHDTIPSQLNPITVPATLSRAVSHDSVEERNLGGLFKWLVGAAAVAALMYLAR